MGQKLPDRYRKIIEDVLRQEDIDPRTHQRLVNSILLTISHLASEVDVERIYRIVQQNIQAER